MATVMNESELTGLGGWLILPLIGLFIAPVKLVFSLINDFFPIFREGYWELFTTPGLETYHHLWAPLIMFEVIGNIIFIIFSIILIFLFFAKSYRLPILYIVYLATNFLFVLGDFFLADLIPAVASENDSESVKELAKAFIGAAIWIPYFLISKRVKNTFLKIGPKIQSESTN